MLTVNKIEKVLNQGGGKRGKKRGAQTIAIEEALDEGTPASEIAKAFDVTRQWVSKVRVSKAKREAE